MEPKICDTVNTNSTQLEVDIWAVSKYFDIWGRL